LHISINLENLSLTEIIQLQNHLPDHIAQRYEQCVAIVFSDIIGSTAFFNRFGNSRIVSKCTAILRPMTSCWLFLIRYRVATGLRPAFLVRYF